MEVSERREKLAEWSGLGLEGPWRGGAGRCTVTMLESWTESGLGE